MSDVVGRSEEVSRHKLAGWRQQCDTNQIVEILRYRIFVRLTVRHSGQAEGGRAGGRGGARQESAGGEPSTVYNPCCEMLCCTVEQELERRKEILLQQFTHKLEVS